MPTHAEQKILPYSPRQLFDVVAAIEHYPDFLPWCIGSRITRREENTVWADLIVGFGVLRETFTSKVTLSAPHSDDSAGRIDVTYLNGPFRRLDNHWIFQPAENGHCRIDFYIDFEFRSHLLQRLMGAVFNEAVRRMVSAFEARAHKVYGAPVTP